MAESCGVPKACCNRDLELSQPIDYAIDFPLELRISDQVGNAGLVSVPSDSIDRYEFVAITLSYD